MAEHQPKKKVIKVTDKRGIPSRGTADPGVPSGGIGKSSETRSESQVSLDEIGVSEDFLSRPTGTPGSATRDDYLGDLQRLQAEFDNYRKRVMRDSAAASDRGAARVIEDLLPVLDNFERAIAHGEGGEGVQLVFKELKDTLEREGLDEVPGEGAAFDPNLHEAIESREVEGLAESAIVEVYRRGYMHKGQLIRPAMVVVGRPVETDEVTE